MFTRTILIVISALLLSSSGVFAQSSPLESFDFVRETKKDINFLYQRYLKLEKELEKFEKASRKSDLLYGVNISLKKSKKLPYELLGLELYFDDRLVFSDFYTSKKNRAFDRGGRQLLYSGAVPWGGHVVKAAVICQKSGSGAVVKRGSVGQLIVKQSTVSYLEVLITADRNALSVQLVNLGQK